jgi:hypothetical protein
MGYKVLVLGNTSVGKSTAIETLPEKETFVVQCTKKDLPFVGSRKKYIDKKNKYQTSKPEEIIKILKANNNESNVKYIVIDDANYIMFYEAKRKRVETGFKKFVDMAYEFTDILETIDGLREDLTVFITAHIEKNDFGDESFKTIGKMLRDQLCIEGLFDIVLLARGIDDDYKFITNGDSVSKSPRGMFEEHFIENDFKKIATVVQDYYG